jgi:pilus assembly protein CpaF
VTSINQPVKPGLKGPDIQKIKTYLINTVARDLESNASDQRINEDEAYQRIAQVYAKTSLHLPDTLQRQIFHDVYDEICGYGPIQILLNDPEITEIMVNGAKQVYIERNGKIFKTNVSFENDQHVMRIIERIVLPLGRRIDADSPTVDARLPDGSRVNAVIPPVAIDGPLVTIRKFSKEQLSIEKLIEFGSLNTHTAEFLNACVVSSLNIIISGGTGSGKTTLLNVLSKYIPEEERVVTIEDSAELRLHQEHVVRMETKAPNLDGYGGVTVRDLVRNALRMRPDRIVVGEVRGGEALDMLQAMNTGHDGSMTTLHANSPRDALSRLETMTLMSNIDFPIRVIREQIASAIDLIVQQSRLRDGSRKVTQVTEVVGMEGDTIVMTDIFKYEETGVDDTGKVLGELKPTGIRPLFSPSLELAGFRLKPEIYGVNIADILAFNRRPPSKGR